MRWLVLLAVFVTKMLSLQATGFMFNTRRAVEINLPFEIAQVFVLFAAWVLCNWSVSTLMDGEGFAGEIWVMSAYSLTPYIVTGLSGILLSNVLSLNEAVFVSGLSALGTAWCAVWHDLRDHEGASVQLFQNPGIDGADGGRYSVFAVHRLSDGQPGRPADRVHRQHRHRDPLQNVSGEGRTLQ